MDVIEMPVEMLTILQAMRRIGRGLGCTYSAVVELPEAGQHHFPQHLRTRIGHKTYHLLIADRTGEQSSGSSRGRRYGGIAIFQRNARGEVLGG